MQIVQVISLVAWERLTVPTQCKQYLLNANDPDTKLTDDVMYSGYIGACGYKLLVVCSHVIPETNKRLLLHVSIAPASTSDIEMWDVASTILKVHCLPNGG